MPLSEPMKAAIVLAIVMALAAAAIANAAQAIANAAQVLASASGAKPVATYAGVGGRAAGGFFEDRLDLDWIIKPWLVTASPENGVG